jgi:hypothetical protein
VARAQLPNDCSGDVPARSEGQPVTDSPAAAMDDDAGAAVTDGSGMDPGEGVESDAGAGATGPEASEVELPSVPEGGPLKAPAPEPQGPPPPLSYVPPEVGEDYVPVSQLPPLPPLHDMDEETGKPVPLQGSESMFLTGGELLAIVADISSMGGWVVKCSKNGMG